MSFKEFVNRPAIKDAFKKFGMHERTPVALRNRPLLIPDVGGPRGLTGTAFDYLVRFHIARELRGKNIKLYQHISVLDRAMERLEWSGAQADRDWKVIFADARTEATAYSTGDGNVRALADVVQYLAMLDVFYRSGYFNSEFRPIPKVSEELLRLLDLFDPVARLSPRQVCLLNPEFVASVQVNGADADLVIDDRLIDLKATAKLNVSLENLLQLAGYAALQQMGGIAVGDEVYQSSFSSVELYFARYGELGQWHIEQLFPDHGFSRFYDAFRAEVEAIGKAEKEPPSRTRQTRKTAGEIAEELEEDIASILVDLPEIGEPPTHADGKHHTTQGIPRLTVPKGAAAKLKANKDYVERCTALANFFGCTFIVQSSGDFVFLKSRDGSAKQSNSKRNKGK